MRKGENMNKTTKTPVAEELDFKAFKKQKEAVQAQATAAIATKLELVEKTIAEIGEISEATGVMVSFYTISDQISGIRRNSDSGWSSSSC
jgi:hypothetical protein